MRGGLSELEALGGLVIVRRLTGLAAFLPGLALVVLPLSVVLGHLLQLREELR